VTPQLPPSQDREEEEIKVAPSVPFFQWAIIAITSILFADSENFVPAVIKIQSLYSICLLLECENSHVLFA
jgi:hypothetical protein